MAEFDRQESMSQNLAGFALTGLTLLVSLFFQQLGRIESLLVFFSIGVMLEVFSAFLTHYRIRRGWKYLGFVLQYTGLLAIILGFAAFFHDEIPNSPQIESLYAVFIFGFLALTFPELYFDYKQWSIPAVAGASSGSG